MIDLARAGADVQAVVSVHGVLATPAPAKKGDIKAAVLVLHGAADPISPKAHRDMFEAEMDAAGARWYALKFGNVVHAYTDVGVNIPPVAVYRRARDAPRLCADARVHRRRVRREAVRTEAVRIS